MHSRSVPFPFSDGFGVECAVDLEVLADALQYVPRHHKLITGVDPDARTHLVLLLSGHDLAVDSADGDPGVQAGLVHGVGDGPSEVVLGPGRAVWWGGEKVRRDVFRKGKKCDVVRQNYSGAKTEAVPNLTPPEKPRVQ